MATVGQWIEGARLRTLPVSVAPVIAGAAVAVQVGRPHWGLLTLALIVGLAVQIGANYANDYSDGIRGTDEHRVGPQRLVGSGAARPGVVKAAAFACFGIACLAGLGICWLTGYWWLVAVGVASVLGAWFYTGGKHPYGYYGLGEVFVFIFFGLVAVLGTVYIQLGTITLPSVVLAIGLGAGTVALLVANNLRDIPTDAAAGKLTLAVKMGDIPTRWFFTVLSLLTAAGFAIFAVLTTWWALLSLAILAPMIPAVKIVMTGTTGMSLIPVLKLVGIYELVGTTGALVGVFIAN